MNRRYALLSIFALLAIGIALLFRFVGPLRPERALSMGLASLRDAQDISGVATVAVLLPGTGQGTDAATPGVPVSLHGAFKFSLPTAAKPGAGAIAFTWIGGGGNGADAYVEARAAADGKSYIRLDRLPIPALTAAGESLNGTWWELDRATSGSLIVSGLQSAILSQQDVKPADGKKSAIVPEPTMLSQTDIAARVARIKDAVVSGELFVTDGDSTAEQVDGHQTYRVMLGLRRDVATALLKDLREALLGRPLTAEEASAAEKDAATSSANVTIWVNQRSGALVQVLIDLDDPAGASRSIQLQSLDLATPVTVEAPPSPKPFASLMDYFHPAPAAVK